MARTNSSMLGLGTRLKNRHLLNTLDAKETVLYAEDEHRPVLIMFICNHCPFVIHLHSALQDFYKEYKEVVRFVAVSSNDSENYPADASEKMKELFEDLGLDFPYLYDESQTFAKELEAACTPDFYLFDSSKALVYRGRFDASSPGNGVEVTGEDLRKALNNLLSGKTIDQDQKSSLGCNIKWKS